MIIYTLTRRNNASCASVTFGYKVQPKMSTVQYSVFYNISSAMDKTSRQQ